MPHFLTLKKNRVVRESLFRAYNACWFHFRQMILYNIQLDSLSNKFTQVVILILYSISSSNKKEIGIILQKI